MPIELGFILERLAEMAEADESLREKQPWKAAHEKDYAWLGDVDHEALPRRRHRREGADGRHRPGLRRHDRRRVLGRCSRVPARRQASDARASLPRTAAYMPMVELLRYLEANGFTNYIASGGDRDFMRPITEEMYGIPPERVIGSSNALAYQDDEHGGTVVYRGRAGLLRRWPLKPVRIWSRVGRRPILAAGTRTATSQCSVTQAGRGGPRFGCSCSMTTTSESSTTPQARRPRSRRQPLMAGPSSASRTTGRPSLQRRPRDLTRPDAPSDATLGRSTVCEATRRRGGRLVREDSAL